MQTTPSSLFTSSLPRPLPLIPPPPISSWQSKVTPSALSPPSLHPTTVYQTGKHTCHLGRLCRLLCLCLRNGNTSIYFSSSQNYLYLPFFSVTHVSLRVSWAGLTVGGPQDWKEMEGTRRRLRYTCPSARLIYLFILIVRRSTFFFINKLYRRQIM